MDPADVPVATAPQELHDASLPAFEQAVEALLAQEGPGVVVDMSPVSFMSSVGLSFLVRVGMQLDREQRRLALSGCSRRVSKLLKMTGLQALLPQYRNLALAQAYVLGEVRGSHGTP